MLPDLLLPYAATFVGIVLPAILCCLIALKEMNSNREDW